MSVQRVRVKDADEAAQWFASRTDSSGGLIWSGTDATELHAIAEALLALRQRYREMWIAEGGRES